MDSAGFVLAGGRSSRMGRDKALLPVGGGTLIEHVAGQVRQAAGSATVVASAGSYAGLGLPVLADCQPGLGPLGGITTALAATTARWNLIVACDMPNVEAAFLQALIEAAGRSGAEAFLPVGASGLPEPLCAVYQASAAAALTKALDQGIRKVTDALAQVSVSYWQVSNHESFLNLNTPQDWDLFQHA